MQNQNDFYLSTIGDSPEGIGIIKRLDKQKMKQNQQKLVNRKKYKNYNIKKTYHQTTAWVLPRHN